MVEIDKIYFFNTDDKSPFVYAQDSQFSTLTLSSTIPSLITTMVFDATNAVMFENCSVGYFSNEIAPDFEKHLPFDGSVPHIAGGINNYRLRLMRKNDTGKFTDAFNRYNSYFAGRTSQIIFHTVDKHWFICYAEFIINDIQVQNDVVQEIEFIAEDSKEERYRINNFSEA